MPALLFDLDGTLADTKPDLHAAMNHVLTKNGLAEVPDDAITNMIGGGAREILKRGLSENGTSLGRRQAGCGDRRICALV